MDSLKKLAQLLWVTGGVLCLMVFFYQATPILLSAVGAEWIQPLAICLLYTVLFVVLTSVFFSFAWFLEKLQDQRHLHETRRKYRETNLEIQRQLLQKHKLYNSYRTRREISHQRRPLWRFPMRGKRQHYRPDE